MDKRFYAWLCGIFMSMFVEAAWTLPDVRIHEGLPWPIELITYVVTWVPAVYCVYRAFGDD